MTTPALSPHDLAARSTRAVAVVTNTAAELGLQVSEPRVLHDSFSIVVHLAPSPIVVRTPLVLPIGHSLHAQFERQQRELDAVAWLGERGVPVVQPSPLVPRAPVQRDGLSMTFWEFVDVAPETTVDYAGNAPLVAQLHAALRDYQAPLPFLAPLHIMVPACFDALESAPDLMAPKDLERARGEWRALQHVLTSPDAWNAAFPNARLQAIHGDAPSYNLIRTTSGIRYADFEDVCCGPIEWDLASIGPEATERYDAAAREAGGRQTDPKAVRVMDAARMLQLVACFALVPQLPMLATGLAPMLENWRAMPHASTLI